MKFSPKHTLMALAVAATSFAASAEGLSYNVGAVTLYKSSGVDQNTSKPTNFKPAIQGGVDYAFSNGFYIGNWNSTGTFGDANLEIDLYGGVAFNLTPDLSFDLSYTHFYYPGQKDWNSGEIALSATTGPFTAKLTNGITGGVNKGQQRASVQYKRAVTELLTMKLVAGMRNSENRNGFNDFSAGLSYDLGNDLSVSGTISGAGNEAGDAGDTRLVLGVTKGF